MIIAVVILCAVWAVVIPTFWFIWLRQTHDPDSVPPGYLDHERAFVLPDLTLSALFLMTVIFGITGVSAVAVTGFVASGMLLFLGLIDLGYDIAHRGKRWEFAGDIAMLASAIALVTLLSVEVAA